MCPRLFTIPAFDLFGRHLGPLTLHTYGVLLAVAFMVGLFVAGREAKRAGLDPGRITDMAVFLLIAGLLGAKAMLLVVDWPYYSQNPRELLSLFQSGGVFYGGLLGALPVAYWYVRRYHLEGWSTADVMAPAVVSGQAIGRLGCFAAGCCWGKPTSQPWAVTFKDAYAARAVGTPLDTPLHPTQLYESAAALAIFAVLLWIARRKTFHGQVILSYIILYASARFVIEFFRGDASRGTVFGFLSTSQFLAILMVLAAVLTFPYLLKNKRLESPAG